MPRPSSPWYRKSHDAWYVKIDGKQIPLKIRGVHNKREAWKAWSDLLSSAKPVSVKQVVDSFLAESHLRLKASTLNWYRRVGKELVDNFGEMFIGKITVEMLNGWINRKSWNTTTKNHAVGILKIIFRWAKKNNFLEKDPSEKLVKPTRLSRGAETILLEKQVEKILREASPALREILEVLYATGARPSELIKAQGTELNIKRRVIEIIDHKTARHGRERIIHFPEETLCKIITLRARDPEGYLFKNTKGNPWTKDALCLAVRRLSRRIGIKFTAYCFRHTFATDALLAGVPDTFVSELLGHNSNEMLHFHYRHLGKHETSLKKALEDFRS